ncbi:hypothetical protein, partial [Staphylococcus aureus]
KEENDKKGNERKTGIDKKEEITEEEIEAGNAEEDNDGRQANRKSEAANRQNEVEQAKTRGENSNDQVTQTVNKKE